MRLAWAAVALVVSMSGSDIERAQALARARDAERQQFHSRYIFNLADPVVTQIEVVTEFRRLVLIAEEHVFRGDWMFTRSVRAGEDALGPTRGVTTIRAQIRLNPLNTFIEPPAYKIAVDGFPDVDTQLTPQYSVPFKTRQGKTLTSLIGATLETTVSAGRIGQTSRGITVTLDARNVAGTVVDFTRLD